MVEKPDDRLFMGSLKSVSLYFSLGDLTFRWIVATTYPASCTAEKARITVAFVNLFSHIKGAVSSLASIFIVTTGAMKQFKAQMKRDEC